MQSVFKLFGEKDTGSFHSQYRKTRISLTAIYSVILVVLLAISSGVTRTVFSERLDQRFAIVVDKNDRIHSVVFPVNAADVREDLSDTLLLVNGILVGISVMLSYWLASKTLKPIQDAYDAQRQFLSDASHELRTPLAILQADLENERDSGTGAARQSAESHLEEVHRMSALVRDVLSLSKLEHVGAGMAPVPVVLNDVLQKVVDRLMAIATQHNVQILLEDASETFDVLALEEPLIRVFTNVIENAILYNRPQGSVVIALHHCGDSVAVDVTDTGTGIGAKDVEKIFDRFYRADKSRSRRTGGSGLGLSIARTIVESFHGTITMESTVDVGTNVHITFPIHKAS